MQEVLFQADRYKINSDTTNENDVREMLFESVCEPVVCYWCTGDDFIKRSKQRRTVLDVHENQVVRVTLERQSYRCKCCGKTLFAQKDPYPEKMHVTSGFADFVSQRLVQERESTLTTMSERYGVSKPVLSNAINDYIDNFNHKVYFVQKCHTIIFYPFEYEHKERCFVCGIGDDNKNVLLGVLDEYNAEEIECFVSDKIEDREDVITVFCDLNEEVIYTLWDMFPDAVIAVNEQLLVDRLNRLTVDNGDGLYNYKLLAIKSLQDVLYSSSAENADRNIRDWFSSLRPELKQVYNGIVDTILFHSAECADGFKLTSDEKLVESLTMLIRKFKSLKTPYRLVKLRMLLTNEAVKNQLKVTKYGTYMQVAISIDNRPKDYCVDMDSLLRIYG